MPVAPLTNVAAALALDPTIAQLYKEVVLMGGNFLAPGNAAKWAEANIWHDPEAAQMVFEAGWPITAVGLDVTNKTMLAEQRLAELADCGTPAARHISLISQFYLEGYAARYGRRECTMHDALALAIAADPSLATHAPRARVDVELTGTHTRGMTVADLRPWAPTEDANAQGCPRGRLGSLHRAVDGDSVPKSMKPAEERSLEKLARPTVPEMDSILGLSFKVLDDGFIRVVDYMGGDGAVVQAARVSYGAGTKHVSDDRGLIRYLMRHMHTTPFEMCELKLHVRAPMDVWRQWIRHRTASINEYSTRYSVAIDAAQSTPSAEWRTQSQENRQGSGAHLPIAIGDELSTGRI